MAEPSDELQPEDQEDEGGAVKSFLEHLEDLRWMLIKTGAATLAGMLVCLFALPYVTAILTWPLKRAQHRHIAFMPEDTNTVVHFLMGTNVVQTIELQTNHYGTLDFGSNQFVSVQLVPTNVGNNTVFSMQLL